MNRVKLEAKLRRSSAAAAAAIALGLSPTALPAEGARSENDGYATTQAAACESPVRTEASATASDFEEITREAEPAGADDEEGVAKPVSVVHGILFYIPNRLLDVIDVARARVRVGPGFGVGVRATTYADAYATSYSSVFAGLPGPRQRATPKLPGGLETLSGVGASVLDASVDGGFGPDYSATECGASAHVALVGADACVDPLEAVDAVLGIFTIDIMDDDL